MKRVVVAKVAPYELVSFGHGLAYLFTNAAEGKEVFLQGEDATQFSDYWQELEDMYPEHSAYAELWNMYEELGSPIGWSVAA